MELSEQEIVRRQSLQAMRDLGINPYPADEYVVTGYSTDIKAGFVDEGEGIWHTGDSVRIAGRLMSKRIMGKASFIELQDSKGRIQVYVSRDDIQLAEDAEKPAPEANDPNGNPRSERPKWQSVCGDAPPDVQRGIQETARHRRLHRYRGIRIPHTDG